MSLTAEPTDRDKSFRCPACDINWPRFTCYHSCPRCEGNTTPIFFQPDYDTTAAAKIRDAWTAWRSYEVRKPSKVTDADACGVHCSCLPCHKAREAATKIREITANA